MKTVLLSWLAGEEPELYVIKMTSEEWDEVKIAHDHYLGECLVGGLDEFKAREDAVTKLALALDKEPDMYDYAWADEVGIDHSWVGRFNHIEKVTKGPIVADELLITGYL